MQRERVVVLMSMLIISLVVLVSASGAQDHGQASAWAQEQVRKQELTTIISAIAEKRAQWVAGETSVSRLTPPERKMRVGLIMPKVTGTEQLAVPETQAYMLAPSFDWRNNGGNYVTPVRDQRSCGSCWAFATTAALEAGKLIAAQTPSTDLNLAEQVLVSCGGAGSCGGGSIDRASNYLRSTGLPVEACYPYTSTNGTCSNACQNWTQTAQKITAWSWVATTAPTVDALKSALSTSGPLVTTMEVYADFFNYRSGVYSYVSGSYQGGHAVLLVGYDDAGQYFIVKNSWGTSWGEAGYFKIAYSQINSVVKFGRYTIAYQVGASPPTPPPEPPPSPTCTYTISPTSVSIGAAGGSGTISINASAGCAWSAADSSSWITSSGSGTGNGTASYAVAANTSTSGRAGTITIADKSCVVSQAGATSGRPRIQVSPTSVSFGSAKVGTSVSREVTVSNTGTGTLTISSVGLSGYSSGSFRRSTACSSVAPGTACSIAVTFAPASSGTKSATLRISSNDTSRGTVSVYLSGRGVR